MTNRYNKNESWQKSLYHNAAAATITNLQLNHHYAVREIASLTTNSKCGMIVVGNVRSSITDNQHDYSSSTSISTTIADFAEIFGCATVGEILMDNNRALVPDKFKLQYKNSMLQSMVLNFKRFITLC